MVRDCMDAKSLMAELEDIGATGDANPTVARAERVLAEVRPTAAPVRLDERAEKMVLLADIVIGELDGLIGSASRMRDALVEMRGLWQPIGEEEEENYEEEVESEEESDAEVDKRFL